MLATSRSLLVLFLATIDIAFKSVDHAIDDDVLRVREKISVLV
jgi:hypothetical protein